VKEISGIHIPVMLNEVVEHLQLRHDSIIVDGTLGFGGHALEIVKHIGPHGRLIGIDRDKEALAGAKQRLSRYIDQCEFVHENYSNVDKVLDSLGIEKVDGIILDLGVSSFQLDNPSRGFSIKGDGPLDMRMNQNSDLSAFDLVNSLSENEISLILKNFGEERWHYRIAKSIVWQRAGKPIETTEELRRAVLKAIPKSRNRQKIHPATRTFQAFRIAVNKELDAIEVVLVKSINYLRPKGRIAVIAFHSLEDRIVKNKFRDFKKSGELQLVVKKPIRASMQESESNMRSRSARLRIAERI